MTLTEKISIWPFTIICKAKRSHSATGTVAGKTDILESVTVPAEEYRKVMLRKDGVFDAIRTKMWWFPLALGNLRPARLFVTSTMELGLTQPTPMNETGLVTAR